MTVLPRRPAVARGGLEVPEGGARPRVETTCQGRDSGAQARQAEEDHEEGRRQGVQLGGPVQPSHKILWL